MRRHQRVVKHNLDPRWRWARWDASSYTYPYVAGAPWFQANFTLNRQLRYAEFACGAAGSRSIISVAMSSQGLGRVGG